MTFPINSLVFLFIIGLVVYYLWKEKDKKTLLYKIATITGILSLVFSFTGLVGSYDTEPLLAIGVLCLAVAGLLK